MDPLDIQRFLHLSAGDLLLMRHGIDLLGSFEIKESKSVHHGYRLLNNPFNSWHVYLDASTADDAAESQDERNV